MKKLIVIICLSLPATSFAGISIFGGQGYGVFRLSGAGHPNISSVIVAGIKFSEYIDFRYMSLDTSLRMPVLPFRAVDIKYNKRGDTYTSYDSDVLGLSFNIPLWSGFRLGLMYGAGRSEITDLTKQPSGDYTAYIHEGFMQAFNAELGMTIPFRMFLISPKIGVLTHFLDSDSGYNNAMSYYLSVSVSYVFEKTTEEKKI